MKFRLVGWQAILRDMIILGGACWSVNCSKTQFAILSDARSYPTFPYNYKLHFKEICQKEYIRYVSYYYWNQHLCSYGKTPVFLSDYQKLRNDYYKASYA